MRTIKLIRALVELLIVALLIAYFALAAKADTIQGYDTLGLAMYCKQYLAAPKLPAVSVLLNTFGNPLPCVEQRIQQGGLQLVEVKLIDATCWRNHNCAPGVPRPDDAGTAKKRAALVQQLAGKYPAIEWWITPDLEHDIKDANMLVKVLKAAQAGCPSCKVFNNPTTGSARPKGYQVEEHGTKVRGFHVSADGASMFDGDNIRSDGNGFEFRTSGQHATFAWFPELNLRCSGEKSFTQPLRRTEKPNANLFEQAYLLMQPEQPKPAAPPQCRTVRDFERNREINKTNAEAYCNGQPKDVRGNKGLFIIKVPGKRGQRMNILRSDGVVGGVATYLDPYKPMAGTHRWYIGTGSRQTPAELYHALGGEWGFADLGGGKCLAINAIRRQGLYK